MSELTPEQIEIFLQFSRRHPTDLARMIKNEQLLLKSDNYWINKFTSFLEDPSLIQKELDKLKSKREKKEARISLMEICLKGK